MPYLACLRCGRLSDGSYCLQHRRRPAREDTRAYKDRPDQAFYQSSQWRKVRAYVKARDDNRCVSCGLQPTNTRDIHVDHIVPWKANPALAYDPANLRCLCRVCHARIGRRTGHGKSL